MKRCPYCAEEIQDAAIVCKHCGRDVPAGVQADAPPAPGKPRDLTGPFLIGVLAIVAIGFAISRTNGGVATQSRAKPISYYISGTGKMARASLTYTDENGSTVQQGNVTLPHTVYLGSVRSGAHLYISAQNQHDSGCVRVAIVEDSVELRKSESCGGYVIATVSGKY